MKIFYLFLFFCTFKLANSQQTYRASLAFKEEFRYILNNIDVNTSNLDSLLAQSVADCSDQFDTLQQIESIASYMGIEANQPIGGFEPNKINDNVAFLPFKTDSNSLIKDTKAISRNADTSKITSWKIMVLIPEKSKEHGTKAPDDSDKTFETYWLEYRNGNLTLRKL